MSDERMCISIKCETGQNVGAPSAAGRLAAGAGTRTLHGLNTFEVETQTLNLFLRHDYHSVAARQLIDHRAAAGVLSPHSGSGLAVLGIPSDRVRVGSPWVHLRSGANRGSARPKPDSTSLSLNSFGINQLLYLYTRASVQDNNDLNLLFPQQSNKIVINCEKYPLKRDSFYIRRKVLQ